MPKANEKIHINDTVLFKQVASVLGKGKALEELTRACRDNANRDNWYWDKSLRGGFVWAQSRQGHEYWSGVWSAINK